MVHRCCISSCGMSVRVVEAKGLSYHKFPTKEPIRDQWVQAIIPHLDKPETFKVVPRYTRVCSRHFRKKDYGVDVKKRARLNSNAVPSVFPRKNTPLVIPTVLPVSPKVTNCKTPSSADSQPGPSISIKSSPLVSNVYKTVGSASMLAPLTPNESNQTSKIDAQQLDNLLSRHELFIESASIQDDHLVLTVMDPTCSGEIESVSVSNSDDQSQTSANKLEETCVVTKRRKRRKWNRTAFARPAKGKRKSVPNKQEPEPSVGDAYAEVSLGTATTIESENSSSVVADAAEGPSTSTSLPLRETLSRPSLGNIRLLLSNSSYQLPSVEQELMQSIQAVSLRCGVDPDDIDPAEVHVQAGVEPFTFSNFVPAFFHHHSSEESLFSNEESHNLHGLTEGLLLDEHQQQQTLPNPEVPGEDDSLRFELVDLRIDPEIPSAPPPTYLDIDELAHQLNSSLFTDGKIPLFNIENLNLSADNSDISLADDILLSSTDSSKKTEPAASVPPPPVFVQDQPKKGSGQRGRGKKAAESKPVNEKKLTGVTKRPKKDKVIGRFCVERFKHSDKDIEYYTGFNSFRNFEAFFRSLEAYIERICITDVTYGVNNMPTPEEISGNCGTSFNADGGGACGSSSNVNPEQPKKRTCQGRAMSRINELFMTIIRLRRKLPEKVLGHMFCISQPTVSRVVRAWTVLLSKIIHSYSTDSPSTSSVAYKEHSYTTKGLGIPDAFRDLFYSDLAKSIVVTSLTPKKEKSKAATSNAHPHRTKKSKLEKPDTSKFSESDDNDCLVTKPDRAPSPPALSDFLLNSDPENPVPIEQLQLFDYI